MRVKLISDLHTEFYDDHGKALINSLPNNNVDVLVVAGDLSVQYHKENLIQLCDEFSQVIFVGGNHCHWGYFIQERIDEFKGYEATISNLHYLQNETVTLNGIRFVGTTLWFPRPINDCYMDDWSDYLYVLDGREAIFAENEKALDFLKNTVVNTDIVVTHHLPTFNCVSPRWRRSPSNCYFVGGAEEIIDNNKPRYILFGHTHAPIDIEDNETICLCNPIGYPDELEADCDRDLIIEV